MPETRIGLVPDVGATHFLSRMPAELELYVGLTGAMLSGADALTAKLADLCVPSAWLDTFETRIESVKWEGDALPLLRKVFEPPCNVVPHAALDSQMPWIVRHFDKRSTVERIVATLTQDLAREELSREHRQWLQATLDALTGHSPTMLCVTREALLRGRQMTLAESFRMEPASSRARSRKATSAKACVRIWSTRIASRAGRPRRSSSCAPNACGIS